MADLLQQGCDWLAEIRARHAGKTVTYRRAEQSVEVTTSIGKTEFEVDDGYGLMQRFESRDFLVLAHELVLSGQATLPASGDRISETQDGRTFEYEVTAPGKEPCWRYSDPYRRTLRIHTKQIAAE